MIVGAGYIGLEMAEAFVARGLRLPRSKQLPEVLPTVDPDLGALVRYPARRARRRRALRNRGSFGLATAPAGSAGRLQVEAAEPRWNS